MDLTHLRKIAGLPQINESVVVEAKEEKASAEHEAKEKELFQATCSHLSDVVAMCEQRLKGELSDDHKKQYEALCACAKSCCADMKKHLTSY